MQHYVIVNDQPWGLPLNETTMAEIFRENGYRTSLLGKWHLGMSQRNFTPTQRGFDRHLGYLGAYVDYYTQSYEQKVGNTSIFTWIFFTRLTFRICQEVGHVFKTLSPQKSVKY